MAALRAAALPRAAWRITRSSCPQLEQRVPQAGAAARPLLLVVLVGLAVPAVLALLAVLYVAGLAIVQAMAAVASEPALTTSRRKMGRCTAGNEPIVAAISSTSMWQAISR